MARVFTHFFRQQAEREVRERLKRGPPDSVSGAHEGFQNGRSGQDRPQPHSAFRPLFGAIDGATASDTARVGVIDRGSERRMRLLGQIAHTRTNAHNRALVFVRLISPPRVDDNRLRQDPAEAELLRDPQRIMKQGTYSRPVP